MHEEEAVGIVPVLHGEQPRVVRSPKRFPPRLVKEIAVRHIGADARQHLPDLFHCLLDRFSMAVSGQEVRLVIGNAGIGWRPRSGADNQRESVQNCRIHAVFLAASIASLAPPARPLLTCRTTSQCRTAANRESTSFPCWSSWRSETGIHADW